ncbi:adenylyltransferase/cytidyltransferase family protein [Natronomonas sp.]|uniref:adenylyltransferase/cytidyltransferase family protein n=1 Tax=Natronomonas sp. TaxID=2184060 RepID=UPI002FC36D2D
MRRAVFLGRFQPFHEGHHRVVSEYKTAFDLVIALGSPEKSRTAENPLTADEREYVIRGCHPDIDVVRVHDEDRGEAGYPVWAERLVDRTGAEVVISGNDLVQRLVREHTDAEIVQQELHTPDRYSGTEIRRRIRAGESWRSLAPDCCADRIAEFERAIRESG